ncbi:MAG: ATP-binding cassette domain-containing protein, partial [Rhizobiaceae bacterium]
MTLLQFSGITKAFGQTRALKGVDFELVAGEIHALVGENGAGKSTLIRILAGDYIADEGEMRLAGEPVRFQHPSEAMAAGIGFVHQRPAFVPDLPITENFLLGLPYTHRRAGLIDWAAHHRECKASLASLGLQVDPRAPLASLSAHQRQMVALARALHRKPKLLVRDEVTASLSEPEVRVLLDTVSMRRA